VAHDDDEMVRRLLELNREIMAGKRTHDPFGIQGWAADQLPEQDLCPALWHMWRAGQLVRVGSCSLPGCSLSSSIGANAHSLSRGSSSRRRPPTG
jgi:hypothetical protein